jgi:hypothetical protein
MRYYYEQIKKALLSSREFPAKFQFQGENLSSNWMNFNRESAEAMQKVCQEFLADPKNK